MKISRGITDITVPDAPSDAVLTGAGTRSLLRQAELPQIPRLAKGAVLPANRPFLAVLGDQTQGTNVEAPLETIRQAVSDAMAECAAQDISINFTGDLAQLGRVLKPVIDAENRRVGTGLTKEEA